jgi:hypothetical protein
MTGVRRREEPDVILVCGHWSNLLGAVYNSLTALGGIEQWCDRCGAWVAYKPKKKRIVKVRDKGVLF